MLIRTLRLGGAALLGFTLAACSPDMPTGALSPGAPSLAVTPVAKKTAIGFREESQDYDWSLTKSVTPSSASLAPGASASFSYTLTATRTPAGAPTTLVGVRGEVCVTNPHTTEIVTNLSITDQIEALIKNVSTGIIASAPISTAANPTLSPGETGCYPYEILFTPVAGATYWNEAIVTGTNLNSRHAESPFTLPATVTVIAGQDESATLSDAYACPTGFTCAASASYGGGSWTLTGTSNVNYDITVTNATAPCSENATLHNLATLAEVNSGAADSAEATVSLATPACAAPSVGTQGCTPGYWKQSQHFGNWKGYIPTGAAASRYEAVLGVDIFPGNPTLLEALAKGGGGEYRFGRHSAAALLNAARSLDYGMTVAQVIATVQAAAASGNYDAAATMFENRNERGCPLGRALL